jgi:hypothetical protein
VQRLSVLNFSVFSNSGGVGIVLSLKCFRIFFIFSISGGVGIAFSHIELGTPFSKIQKNLHKTSGTEARIAEKSLERKFLARVSRLARAARAARAASPAALLGLQRRSPYVELGTPISKITKIC